jgi:hypothetical protein
MVAKNAAPGGAGYPDLARPSGRLCPALTSPGTAPVMRHPVTRHVERPAMLARGGDVVLLSALLRL